MSQDSLVTKPASGHWTDAYPELGRGPVSLQDCVSQDFYDKERDHVFRMLGQDREIDREQQGDHHGQKQPAAPIAPAALLQATSAVHPTLPSSEMPISFCASTANSIGSFCITSRQKPLTISATASSVERPRWRQ